MTVVIRVLSRPASGTMASWGFTVAGRKVLSISHMFALHPIARRWP